MRIRIRNRVAAALVVMTVTAGGLAGCSGEAPPQPPIPPAPMPTVPLFPSGTSVHAFIDTTGATGASKAREGIESLRQATQVTDVHPTYVECDEQGRWTQFIRSEIDTAAMDRGVSIAPRVDCQSTKPEESRVERILTSPTLTQEWVARTVDLVKRYEYDGVVVDFEIARSFEDADEARKLREAFTRFVDRLRDELPADAYLMVVTSPRVEGQAPTARSELYDLEELGRIADRLFVMAWRKGDDGALNPLAYVDAAIDQMRAAGVMQKAILGMPLYAIDRTATSDTALTMRGVDRLVRRASTPVTRTRDADGFVVLKFTVAEAGKAPAEHQIWCVDAKTVRARVERAVAARLGGVGFWRLGQELTDGGVLWEELGN